MPYTTMKTNFVIQRHVREDDLHWDLMIEKENTLKTWRINLHVDNLPNSTTPAEQIFDHETRFLTYTGPVNKGTGSVNIEDKGICNIATWNSNSIKGEFTGAKLQSKFTLTRNSETRWELTCR